MFWKRRYTIFLKGSDWDNGYFDWETDVCITSSLSLKRDKVNVKTSRGYVKTWLECSTPYGIKGSPLCIIRMCFWHCLQPLGRIVKARQAPHKRAILSCTWTVSSSLYSLQFSVSDVLTPFLSYSNFFCNICMYHLYWMYLLWLNVFHGKQVFLFECSSTQQTQNNLIPYFLDCLQKNIICRN